MRIIPPIATHGARFVARWLPDAVWRGPTDGRQKVAYLTFDDGPTPTLTQPLLDRLAAYDAKATFFLIGGHAEQHPDLVRAIARAGHTIGNHTYTHPYPWQTPAARLQAQLDRTSKLLSDQTGQAIRYVRPPYGQLNGAIRTWCSARAHRPPLRDVGRNAGRFAIDQAYIERFVQAHIRPGSIIVLHDNPIVDDSTPAALDTLLRVLSADGWQFNAL